MKYYGVIIQSHFKLTLLPKHSCVGVYVVVQFYPGFKFYFPLILTHYHTLPYTKTKENKN